MHRPMTIIWSMCRNDHWVSRFSTRRAGPRRIMPAWIATSGNRSCSQQTAFTGFTSLMIAAWQAAMAFDGRARLREIACPTLVLAGAADKGVPMHHARQLHEGIARSRLVVVDGADHAMIWADPDRFAREVDAFLEG